MNQKIRVSEIFISFFLVSLCTFGGGYAMLPMLEHEIVEKRGWLGRKELIDLFAVAQSLPGIIGINIACLVVSKAYQKDARDDNGAEAGCDTFGAPVLLALIAAAAVMLPCIIIILIIAIVLTNFRENEIVQHALSGVSICVLALILNTIIKMWKSSIKNISQIVLFAGAFAICCLTNISPIFAILGGGVIGAVFGAVAGRSAGRETGRSANCETRRRAGRETGRSANCEDRRKS